MLLNKKIILGLCFTSLLSACSSAPSKTVDDPNAGRYQLAQDKAPQNAPDLSKIENAHPKYEALSRGGNKPYTLWGKDYHVLSSAKGFSQRGVASWYGSKFHGHLTSNGETYDMYSMSAAHKTLPLPTYVKVTNLDNHKTVIVRVNDRGPFHDNRIIDLSYAAAYKLDMLKTGTANVEINAIYFDSPASHAIAQLHDNNVHFIQVMATGDHNKAAAIQNKLLQQYKVDTRVVEHDKIYRIQIGPINQLTLANKLLETLKTNGFTGSYILNN